MAGYLVVGTLVAVGAFGWHHAEGADVGEKAMVGGLMALAIGGPIALAVLFVYSLFTGPVT